MLLPAVRAESENEDEIKTNQESPEDEIKNQESPEDEIKINQESLEEKSITEINDTDWKIFRHIYAVTFDFIFFDFPEAISNTAKSVFSFLFQKFKGGLDSIDALYDNLPKTWREDPDPPYYILPPELPKGYQHPLTVCIDIDLMIDDMPDKIRGGAEYFVVQTSQFAEIVLLCRDVADLCLEPSMEIDKALLIPFRLSSEHWYEDGAQERWPIKRNLNRLNRDLSRVVVLDFDKTIYPQHADNVLLMPKVSWMGDSYDTELFDIVPVLYHFSKEIAKGKDIRDVLKHYEDVDPAKVGRMALGFKTSKF